MNSAGAGQVWIEKLKLIKVQYTIIKTNKMHKQSRFFQFKEPIIHI